MPNEKTRILIVDDSEDDRDMYAQFLSRKGYQISKARDGKEGVEKAFELQPHLMLIDLWLPRMSGWQVVRCLRADERTKKIPLLVITAHVSGAPLERDGLLTKPCQLNQLDAEITRILDARKGFSLSPTTVPTAG